MSSKNYNEFTLYWTLDNAELWYQKFGEGIMSPEVTAGTLLGTRWYMVFYPKGDREEHKEYCSCYLFRSATDAHDLPISIQYTMEILSPSGTCWVSKNSVLRTFDCCDNLGWYTFCKIKYLSDIMSDLTEKFITIRCKIMSNDVNCKPITSCNVKTSFNSERCTFSWDLCSDLSAEWKETKKFTFPNTSEFNVTLSINEEDLIVKISKMNETSFSQLINCKVTLINNKKKEVISKCQSNYFSEIDDSFEFTFINTCVLDGDSSKLLFEISSSNSCTSTILKYNDDKIQTLDVTTEEGSYNVLHNDLRELFLNKLNSDVDIKVGDETFPGHKGILAARSPVFRAMFTHNMLENQTNCVKITDINPKVITSFLQFLYTATVDTKNYEHILELLMMAHSYEVHSLIEVCCSFLIPILSHENVCNLIYTGDLIKHKVLKTSAIDYIKLHCEILISNEWKEWYNNHPVLGNEVIHEMSKKLKKISK